MKKKNKKSTAQRLGLPTYPIQDGMNIGKRTDAEYEWLLLHGNFQTDIDTYYRISKKNGVYYLHHVDNTLAVLAKTNLIAQSDTLKRLCKETDMLVEWMVWFLK